MKNEQKRNSPTSFRMCKQEEEEKDDDNRDSEENKRAFCDKFPRK
jgi:hypothetical protein